MCTPVLAAVSSVGLQMAGQYAQGKAQSNAYKNAAKQAEWNQKAESEKASRQADVYAQKQGELRDKYNLQRGQRIAAMGASGLQGNQGSGADLSSSELSAFRTDTQNNLANQRQDAWNSYVNQVNYQNQASQYKTAAKNTMAQTYMGMLGTALGGYSTIYGKGGVGASNATSSTSSNAWYDANFNDMKKYGLNSSIYYGTGPTSWINTTYPGWKATASSTFGSGLKYK